MLSEAALPRALELYCSTESAEDERSEGLNVVLVQLHRGRAGTLNELVAGHLRRYLTSEEGMVRMRGTKLLAEVLRRLPELKIDGKMAYALANFLLDRYKTDFESSAPALSALSALLEVHEDVFPVAEGFVQLVLRALLTVHYVPPLTQSLRLSIYQMILKLVERPRTSDRVFEMDGGELVPMFVDAMDGEKDPRCLLVCLRVAAGLLRDKRLQFKETDTELSSVEQVFEVSSVYFPIVFRPPANDPYNIKAEDLWEVLHGVFTSHALMADQVLDMLVEKLQLTTNDATMAKVDSLQTLKFCVPSYGIAVIEQHLPELRRVLMALVMEADEAIVADEALSAIQTIARQIAKEKEAREIVIDTSTDGEAREDPWNVFVVAIADESSIPINQSIDSMKGRAAGSILATLAKSSAVAFTITLEKVVGPLQKWCVRPDASETQKSAAFEMVLKIVEAIDRDIDYQASSHPLRPEMVEGIYKFEMEELREPGLMEISNDEGGIRDPMLLVGSTRRLAMQALVELTLRPPSPLLSVEQIEKIVMAITEVLLDVDVGSVTEVVCLNSLVKLGKARPVCADVISRESVPSLEAKSNLNAIAELCAIPQVFDSSMPRMLAPAPGKNFKRVLDVVADIVEGNQGYTRGLEKCCYEFEADNEALRGLLPGILVKLAQGEDLGNPSLRILRCITKNVSEQVQNEIAQFLEQYVHGSMNPPLLRGACAVLDSLRPVALHNLDVERSISVLKEAAQADGPDQLMSAQSLGSLFNKLDDSHNPAIAPVCDELCRRSSEGCVTSLVALTWCSKGLAMKSHAFAENLALVVPDLIGNPQVSLETREVAAEFFGKVVRSTKNVLCKDCFCVEKLFFQQRYFKQIFPALRERFQGLGNRDEASGLFLLAACRLLEHTPSPIMLLEIETVAPFLTQALTNPSLKVQTSALTSLSFVVERHLNALEPHLATIIPVLCNLAQCKPGIRARHRATAIKCLEAFAAIKYNQIHSFRHLVTKSLLVTLDDPKRAIRKLAVECRNSWLMLQVL